MIPDCRLVALEDGEAGRRNVETLASRLILELKGA
jgi:hypothetical protein